MSARKVGGLWLIDLGPFHFSICKVSRAKRRLAAAKAKARLFAD